MVKATRFILAGIVLLAACDDDKRQDKLENRIALLESNLEEMTRRLEAQQEVINRYETLIARNTAQGEAQKASVDQLAPLADLMTFVRVEGDDVIFEGANIHIRNGSGETAEANGRGNLVVGYNEDREDEEGPADRSGSHNLVLGERHAYTSFSGFVGGYRNTISGPHAAVIAGAGNEATEVHSVVVTGVQNSVSGSAALVGTGQHNAVTGAQGFIGTGDGNQVDTIGASILGGRDQDVVHDRQAVLGYEDPINPGD
jgi:hypothetical protein